MPRWRSFSAAARTMASAPARASGSALAPSWRRARERLAVLDDGLVELGVVGDRADGADLDVERAAARRGARVTPMSCWRSVESAKRGAARDAGAPRRRRGASLSSTGVSFMPQIGQVPGSVGDDLRMHRALVALLLPS